MKFSTFWLNVDHQKSRIFGIALFGWKKSNTNEPNLNLNIRVSKCYEWPSLLITPFWQRQWQSFCDSFSTVGLKKEAERSVQFQDMPLYLRCPPLPSLPMLLCSSSSNQIFSNSAKLVFFWFSVYTTFLQSQTPLSRKLFLFFSCFSSTKQICFS